MEGAGILGLASRPLPRGTLRLAALAMVVAAIGSDSWRAAPGSISVHRSPPSSGRTCSFRRGIPGGHCPYSRWRFAARSRYCAPRACPLGRSPAAPSRSRSARDSASHVGQRGEREWWWPLVRPNSRVTEYPAAYPFVRGHVLAFIDHFAESVPKLPEHPSGHPVGATLAFFELDNLTGGPHGTAIALCAIGALAVAPALWLGRALGRRGRRAPRRRALRARSRHADLRRHLL